jgi:hypothetical protein
VKIVYVDPLPHSRSPSPAYPAVKVLTYGRSALAGLALGDASDGHGHPDAGRTFLRLIRAAG